MQPFIADNPMAEKAEERAIKLFGIFYTMEGWRTHDKTKEDMAAWLMRRGHKDFDAWCDKYADKIHLPL